MGGTKKPTIPKLKKLASRREEKSKKEEKKKEPYKVYLTDREVEEIVNYVKRQRYITPYIISRKAEIKLSIARNLLRNLANEGIVKLEEKNRELEIYIPISS